MESALKAGYRHIDCAPVYRNQTQVGAALTAALASGLCTRDDLFITSKLMTYDLAPDGFEQAVKQSLAELGVGYLDLLLLQWPLPQLAPVAEQWAAMEALVDAGLVRDIGVSNFSAVKLAALMDGGATGAQDWVLGECRVKPSVNQVECGAHFRQEALLEACKTRGVVMQAYGPLGSGDQFSADGLNRKRSGPPPLEHPAVVAAAADTGMTPAQVLIRWNIDRGVAVLPKSSNPTRQAENLAAAAAAAAATETTTFLPTLPSEHAAAVGAFSEQYRLQHGAFHTGPGKAYPTLADLWDEDCGYMEGREFEQPAGFKLK